MMAGWHVRVLRAALIPCPLVLMLAGCTPTVKVAPGQAGGGALGGAQAPASAVLQARLDALSRELSQEQQNNTALQAQLNERGQEVERLRTEVQESRARESDLHGALERASAAASDVAAVAPALAPAPDAADGGGDAPEFAAAETATRDDSDPADKIPPGVLVASLRQALSQEQERRQAAETQLERLQEETSTLPYGDGGPLAVDFAAAKQEIVELRRVLDDERAARARLADDLRALQLRVGREGSLAGDGSGDNPELQVRLEKLQAERQAAVDTFSRNLAASLQRTSELEAELATARAAAPSPANPAASAAAPDGEMASVQAENAALRTRLDEEHRRTEELASKLKLATRVTDLIFKMQTQQSVSPRGR